MAKKKPRKGIGKHQLEQFKKLLRKKHEFGLTTPEINTVKNFNGKLRDNEKREINEFLSKLTKGNSAANKSISVNKLPRNNNKLQRNKAKRRLGK